MANKKFSQFSNVPHTATTFVVGYDGAANVRMLASSVGGSTDNVYVPKGLCKYPNSYGISPILLDSPFSNLGIRFQPAQVIQIYQDTEIQEIRLNVVIASATDEWYVGLYKYDLPNDKYVKQCQWDVTTLSVAGMLSQSLGSPITITSGTYFLGTKSKDVTAEGPATNATYTSIPIVEWYTAAADIATTSSHINNMSVTTSAGAVLIAEFAGSSMVYNRSTYPIYGPHLVY